MRGSILAGQAVSGERRIDEAPRSIAAAQRTSAAALKRAATAQRPIAAGLNLGHDHVDTIDQSHERCVALGVSRIERPDFSLIGRSDLNLARDRNLRLHEHAAPVMEMLYEQIINTESMVVLTDATGTILHSIGDDDFLGRAAKVALAPGANWSESAKGTNAVGTALMAETPTLVHADEHYLHANHFLTCSAAPILDPRGNILGVLDVSGDHRSYHQHTMALVKMSARMIENHWLTDDYHNVMRLHFHSRVEFIGTLMEGIVAVSADGKLVGANRGALEQLGLSGAALRMHSLTSLFGTTVNALVDRFRSPLATPMPVHVQGARHFHLHARFNWPVWTSLAEAVIHAPAGGHSGGAAVASGTDSAGGSSAKGQRSAIASQGSVARPAADVPAPGLTQLDTGDAQLSSAINKIRRVLDRDIPIMIMGDSGTGKELLARAIHHDSARAAQPFVTLNCAAMADRQAEAELLGSEEGSFTGVRRTGMVGKIVQANGGTLFLDEIGEMPASLQNHLLRLLRERLVSPMGGASSVAVDVAILCASRYSAHELIAGKRIREDLFYRLDGLTVRLPRLAERSDQTALARVILERSFAAPVPQLSLDAAELFTSYHWPGNVRQMCNVLRTAAVLASGGAVIRREHLPDELLASVQARGNSVPASGHGPITAAAASGHTATAAKAGPSTLPACAPTSVPTSLPAATRPLDELQIEAIQAAVLAAGGNISEASKRLGISRNTIYRKLRWNVGR